MVESLAHDAPHLASVLDRERAVKRRAHGGEVVEAHRVVSEFLLQVFALDIHSVGLVEPHVEWRFHGHVASAVIVFELMDYDAVGIDQARVGRPFVDKRRFGDHGRVPDVLHAAEIRFLHADRAVAFAAVFVAEASRLPKDGVFGDFHRDARAFRFAGRHQVFKADFAAGAGFDRVGHDVPCAGRDNEQVWRHGDCIHVGDGHSRRVVGERSRRAVGV